MPVQVLERILAAAYAQVGPGKQPTGQVGMSSVDAAIDQSDDYTSTGARVVSAVDLKEIHVPLLVPYLVSELKPVC